MEMTTSNLASKRSVDRQCQREGIILKVKVAVERKISRREESSQSVDISESPLCAVITISCYAKRHALTSCKVRYRQASAVKHSTYFKMTTSAQTCTSKTIEPSLLLSL